MEKRYKYAVPYLSRDLIYQKIHPLRDAAFGADFLTPFRFWKMKFLHLLSTFHGYIFNPSDTKCFGTTSDTGGRGRADPLVSRNSLDVGT